MGNNILTTAGAIILATSINGNESSELQELDITVVFFIVTYPALTIVYIFVEIFSH